MAEPAPPANTPSANTLGLVAMILGIVSLPLVFCYLLGLPAGAAAVVLGVIGINRANRGHASNRGQAIAGVVLGAIAVIAMIVIIALPD